MKTIDRQLHGSNRYQSTKPPKRKRHYTSGDTRRQVDERRRKFKMAGIPQIEDSHLLDTNPPGRKKEAELAKVIAAACEQFRLNHIPAPERVTVVEEVEDDD